MRVKLKNRNEMFLLLFMKCVCISLFQAFNRHQSIEIDNYPFFMLNTFMGFEKYFDSFLNDCTPVSWVAFKVLLAKVPLRAKVSRWHKFANDAYIWITVPSQNDTLFAYWSAFLPPFAVWSVVGSRNACSSIIFFRCWFVTMV